MPKTQSLKQGLHLTPIQIVEFMCKVTLEPSLNDKSEPVNILDPCAGSGRFLLEAYKISPNADLFGVDIDLDLVRTCITNLELRNIKNYYILNADSLTHELQLDNEDGIYNWKYSNSWKSHISELKTTGKKKSQGELFKY